VITFVGSKPKVYTFARQFDFLLTQPHRISSSFNFLATQNLKIIHYKQLLFTDSLANIQMELKLRFIFIISCWPGGPTPYRIRRCPDWGYLGADKFERGLSQVPAQLGYARPTHAKKMLVVVDPEPTCMAPENNYTTCKA
jgi:hypothetical protein